MADGIYEATWFASWKVELRIDDDVFISARDNADTTARRRIITQFKGKCSTKFKKKPEGFIDWDSPHFDIKRVRDAS